MRIRTLVIITTLVLVIWPIISALRALAVEQHTAEEKQDFVEGAKLWPVYCAQCHNARPGSQFSPAQWDAITMHMRTLSNMPAKDMRSIKVFLKEAR
jgi:mono/diheme cytochrome c family protein